MRHASTVQFINIHVDDLRARNILRMTIDTIQVRSPLRAVGAGTRS